MDAASGPFKQLPRAPQPGRDAGNRPGTDEFRPEQTLAPVAEASLVSLSASQEVIGPVSLDQRPSDGHGVAGQARLAVRSSPGIGQPGLVCVDPFIQP